MALTPRFRPGAVRRPFVDREQIVASFDESLATVTEQPCVMVLTGIGGIGKSRLLTELRGRVEDRHPTAHLDLQVPSLRQPEHGLAILRTQFGRKKIKFHRFDIAYAVLWQRLNPHLPISNLTFAQHSEILTDVLNDASGVPVFGTAAKLIDASAKKYRTRQWIRRDETLQVLDKLTSEELFDAVGYLFAVDLREGIAAAEPYVVFVDAYEALAGRDSAGAAVGADWWLRDLVGQLDRGLVVMASREAPGWERIDPEWSTRLRTLVVDDLPAGARDELLTASGVTDDAERRAIAASSAGVPFYLHLAVECRTGDACLRSQVSPEALLERFLRHVDAQEIRLLELLSTTRIFDFDIFVAIAEEFGLPAHELAWESLTGYSFVQSAGTDGSQVHLHQLMVEALRHRSSPAVVAKLQHLMRALWDQRADRGEDRVVALREAAWHGLHAGALTTADLLGYVDLITTAGGKQGIDGVLADLREYLEEETENPDLNSTITEFVRYLEVEEALMRGDAERAAEITGVPPTDVSDVVAARLAVSAANARRILGWTDAALSIYRRVWQHGHRAARLQAGVWAADLDMAQGRFATALAVAAELINECPTGDHEFLGDVERLLCLAGRFSFDLAASARHLEEAEAHYRRAGSVVGMANTRTNRAELLALVDPANAIIAAGAAIEAQREIGALHELGKAYSALGLAHLALGDLERADEALAAAVDALDRAGYRSGRARAELFRAALSARRGEVDDARTKARWAVAELEGAEVYPTLVLIAERLLELVGAPDPEVRAAAARARPKIELPASAPPLSVGMGTVLNRLIGVDTNALYQEARAAAAQSAGYYNHNVRAETRYGPVNVRIPVPGADQMDLRIWPEFDVLRAIAPFVSAAPRLRWDSLEPPFQLHEFVAGTVLNDVAPRGEPVPDHVLGDVVTLFAELAKVPVTVLPEPAEALPADGDTPAFAARLLELSQGVYRDNKEDFAQLFRDLGYPKDPLAPAVSGLRSLAARPFRLVHADVHRKNMILSGDRVVFIDWELALLGDPIYDLAAHLHKMAYLPDERQRLLTSWEGAEPDAATAGWLADLDQYLRHERLKSAVVDSVRYAKEIRQGCSIERERILVDKLVGKVAAAREIWQQDTDVDRDEVRRAAQGRH